MFGPVGATWSSRSRDVSVTDAFVASFPWVIRRVYTAWKRMAWHGTNGTVACTSSGSQTDLAGELRGRARLA